MTTNPSELDGNPVMDEPTPRPKSPSGKFYLEYPVENLRPAPYNPRRIDDAAFSSLCHSLRTLGMVKPIIINDDHTIVAGHQRLRALKETGATVTPVYLLYGLTKPDEMRFNQLHNGTDLDTGDEHVQVPANPGFVGYCDVPATAITGNLRSAGAPLRSEISKLLVNYGPWGGIVATQSGECISGAQYALSCRNLGVPCRTYYVPDDQAQRVKAIFQKAYGQFHYDELPRETYIQTFAQPFRCRTDAAGNAAGVKSPTWEKRVLPEWQTGERILDFGCGQADYLKKLRRERPDIPLWGVEFFYRSGDLLDTAMTHKMCGSLFQELRTNGLFDVVVCDYVINSVDSVIAEESVVTCLNAFCKPGGRIYMSGRRRDFMEQNIYATSHRGGMRGFEFLDEHGFSGILFKGRWFYQLFHTKAQACDLAERFLASKANFRYKNHSATQFNIRAVKDKDLPVADVEAALRFEFDLMWPDGQSVGKAEEAIAAWHAARAVSG